MAAGSTFTPVLIAVIVQAAHAELRRAERRYGGRSRMHQYLPASITYTLTIVLSIILTTSVTYLVPSDALRCQLGEQWGRLFHRKDINSIRTIQSNLRCCGLNSMRDRAWPFPANGIGAGECERTQGWSQRCLEGWTREERVTGCLIMVASVLTGLSMVGVGSKGIFILLAD